jgi:hypothetical protein
MKILLIALSLLSTSVAFSAEQPKGLGQFDPQQCGCETCFTKYGVCTAVNQGNERKDLSRKSAGNKRGTRSKTTAQ